MAADKDSMHSERSMVLYKVTFNERNNPNKILHVYNVGGFSCADLFSQFAEDMNLLLLPLRSSNRFIKIVSCKKMSQSLLIKVNSGSSGENVDVVDIESGNTEYTYGNDKAAMVDSRCFVSQAFGASYALLCIEHTRNGAGDTSLFEPFRSFLKLKVPQAVVKFEPLIEPEVIENFISVESVEVKKYIEAGDSMDLLVSEAGTVTTRLTHKRGRPFHMNLYKRLIDTKGRAAASLLGLNESTFDDAGTEVSVVLKHRSGVKKTFVISDPLGIKIREVLNRDGEPPFTDERFIEECESRCDSASKCIGMVLG